MSLRPCSLDDYETKFNRANSAQPNVKNWFEKGSLICLEEPENDFNLRGRFGSTTFDMVRIAIERCHDKPECKSDREINEFLDSAMLVSVLNNQEYSPNSYGNKTVEDSLEVLYKSFDWRIRPYLNKIDV